MLDVHHRILLAVGILIATTPATDAGGQDNIATQQHGFLRTNRALKGVDLNIRYSKTPFVNASLAAYYLPLHKKDYPIQGNLAHVLKTETLAASPILANDPEVQGEPVFPGDVPPTKGQPHVPGGPGGYSYVSALGSLPTFPTSDSNDPFWEDFRVSVQYQTARRNNDPTSTLFTLPDIWSGFNLSQVAAAVHNDFPGYWTSLLLESFVITQKAPVDYHIIPFRSLNDPLGVQYRNVAINGWVLATIQPITYRVKWNYGRPRPEEIAWLITTGNLTAADGVPADLVATVLSWNLTAATQYTAYPEGCPNHPAWPSGHASISQNSLWQAVVLNLTDAQYCQTLLFDYAYPHARILAGLHYPTDVFAGLKLGQEVVTRLLPSHLASLYGSDPAAVAAKIAKYTVDWEKFDPASCKFGS
jgi:membrane-associated phospholipid phosphatase